MHTCIPQTHPPVWPPSPPLVARPRTNAQRAEVDAELALAQAHLEELRSGGRLTTQSQLDSAQSELAEAVHREAAARAAHDAVGGGRGIRMHRAAVNREAAARTAHDAVGGRR
eukprot:366484-Chlamydomonas_euryale.AAC.1